MKYVILKSVEESPKLQWPQKTKTGKLSVHRRRVFNWYNKREGKVLKVGDHIRYTVAGPESVREIKVKWDDGETEWVEPAKLVDKESGTHLNKMAKHEIEGKP